LEGLWKLVGRPEGRGRRRLPSGGEELTVFDEVRNSLLERVRVVFEIP
jgi:hypothetical protein